MSGRDATPLADLLDALGRVGVGFDAHAALRRLGALLGLGEDVDGDVPVRLVLADHVTPEELQRQLDQAIAAQRGDHNG